MAIDRRAFLERGIFLGTSVLVGCVDDETSASHGNGGSGGGAGGGGNGAGGAGGGVGEVCDDPFEGGQNLGAAIWTETDNTPLDQKVGSGLGARLFTDLSTLTEDDLITPIERFYIRTEYPSATLDPNDPYVIQISGLVQTPVTLPIEQLLSLVEPHGLQLLECSGNYVDASFGLMSVADWAGVPMQKIFDMVDIDPSATRVLIRGFDHLSGNTPGASWIYTFDQLLDANAILASEMNGVALTPDHGAPVRLLAPNWFGCCNIKWVNQIVFVNDDEPSTEHMKEYASRTLQSGVPALARDYIPATMDQTAIPTVVEKWSLDGQIVYRIRGIMWGGYKTTDKLAIAFDNGPHLPVTVCPTHNNNRIWTLWEHLWVAPAPGEYLVDMHIDDASVPQRRLASGRYHRRINIDEV